MAITYSVSINTPDFKLKDELGNATTSVTTTGVTIPKELYSTAELYTTDAILYTSSNKNYTLNALNKPTYYSQDSDFLRIEAETVTVQASFSGISTGTSIYEGNGQFNKWTPANTYLLDNNVYRLYSRNSELSYIATVQDYTSVNVTYSEGNRKTLIRFLSDTANTSTSVSSVKTVSNTYYFSQVESISTQEGLNFRSSSDSIRTWYSSISNSTTSINVSEFKTFSVGSDDVFTLYNYSSKISWNTLMLVLNRNVTDSTTWLGVPELYTSTMSEKGIIADEDGNVMYGTMYGSGGNMNLSTGYVYRPAVITAFSKETDVSTVDTTWFGTFTYRKSNSGTYSTADTYVEYNNYGVGGTISYSTYTWHTSSKTAYSESSRTSGVYIYGPGLATYSVATIPTANILSIKVSDNSCPFMSSSIESVTSSRTSNSGSYSTSYESTFISSSSEEVNRTLTEFYTTVDVGLCLLAYNTLLSVTNTYSTCSTVLSTSRFTTYIEVTETTSCDVTSFTNNNGYSYYTTFYGEIANETFYATSWVNSAVVSYDTNYIESILTFYTVGRTYKTFGDIVNSTTIYDESVVASTVYTTMSASSMVSELTVDSYTSSSVDAPIEYFTTEYETLKKSSVYGTYIGPKYSLSYWDIDVYTVYDLNVSVTEVSSNTYDWTIIGSSQITSSTFNTSDYGTTYRLSNLKSSNSWFNAGSINGTINYVYSYDVNSMFSYNTIITTLSNYTTVLATSYSAPYNVNYNYDTYSITKSSSLAVKSTGERFIDRVEISRTSTVSYEVTNQIAVYNGSTMATLSSNASSYNMQSDQDVSTVAQTFISSTADLDITTEIDSSATTTSARGSFIYSSREMVSSTMEQQNDTLIFASTFNTYSFYNSSYTTSTLNTVVSTLSATTYEDWYNPVSWTSTALSVATATRVVETVSTTSGMVSVTQSVDYTPVYSTVDGVYVTA